MIFGITSYVRDGGYRVRKVLPSGECTRSVCLAHIPSVHQFLIHITFVLLLKIYTVTVFVVSFVVHMARHFERWRDVYTVLTNIKLETHSVLPDVCMEQTADSTRHIARGGSGEQLSD